MGSIVQDSRITTRKVRMADAIADRQTNAA
nr:MAG TPA: hypothetical protein [Caudoviricetes sp.]